MSGTLEEKFVSCPECSVPWRLHWMYVWEDGQRKRTYNTCGLTRDQIATRSPTNARESR